MLVSNGGIHQAKNAIQKNRLQKMSKTASVVQPYHVYPIFGYQDATLSTSIQQVEVIKFKTSSSKECPVLRVCWGYHNGNFATDCFRWFQKGEKKEKVFFLNLTFKKLRKPLS